MALTQISTQGIKDGTITNADIGSSAAIAGSKINPNFGSQNIETMGNASIRNILTISGSGPSLTLTDIDNNPDYRLQNDNGKFRVLDYTNSADRLLIDTSGNVGIGTSTIGEKLTIGDGDLKFFNSDAANNHRTTFIEFQNSSNRITSESNFGSDGSSGYAAGYKFSTKNYTGSAFETLTPFVIQANGNVGVGTSSPDQKLVVQGSGTTILKVENTDDGTAQLTLGNTGSSNFAIQQVSGNASFRIGGNDYMVIDASGRVLIGHTSDIGYGFRSQLVGTDGNTSSQVQIRFTNSASGPTFVLAKSRNGTPGSKTIVNNNDNLGEIQFRGDDGVDYLGVAASINAEVDGTPGAGDLPGRLVFSTTADGADAATERMRIDSSGNVGIGTTSPAGKIDVFSDRTDGIHGILGGTFNVNGVEHVRRIQFGTTGSNRNFIQGQQLSSGSYIDADLILSPTGGRVGVRESTPTETFHVSGSMKCTDRIRNQRTGNGTFFDYFRNNTQLFVIDNLSNNSNTRIRIRNPNGSIMYNSSSDYRLKENDIKITDGIIKLKKLRPIRFNWKTDTSTQYDGFFAHEVSEACPDAVDGIKDEVALQDIESENLKKGDPIYQGIDASKLIPLLTAALQETIVKIETLETKVAALETS